MRNHEAQETHRESLAWLPISACRLPFGARQVSAHASTFLLHASPQRHSHFCTCRQGFGESAATCHLKRTAADTPDTHHGIPRQNRGPDNLEVEDHPSLPPTHPPLQPSARHRSSSAGGASRTSLTPSIEPLGSETCGLTSVSPA